MDAFRPALVLMLLAAPAGAAAQELAGSFDQLRVLVKQGDRIRVTDAAGADVTGTILNLDASTLTLAARDGRRDFTASDVDIIRQRRSDSLANGAKWGLGIGAGLGLLGGLALAGADGSSAALIPIVSLVYGGIGAGIGAGVDALISSEQVIYAKRRAQLTVSVGF